MDGWMEWDNIVGVVYSKDLLEVLTSLSLSVSLSLPISLFMYVHMHLSAFVCLSVFTASHLVPVLGRV